MECRFLGAVYDKMQLVRVTNGNKNKESVKEFLSKGKDLTLDQTTEKKRS